MNGQFAPIGLRVVIEHNREVEVIVQRPRDRESRFKPFDLGIGERYRQEKMRAEQIRESQS